MTTDPARSTAADLYQDFFVSRAGTDSAFAVWVGELIRSLGRTHILQDEHFGHQDFMGAMDSALKSGARVMALLSQAYLNSDHCLKEATTAIHGDPFNRQQRLTPLRKEPCAPDGMLRNVAYTDLVAEHRQADGSALALKILRALGCAEPSLAGMPRPPPGILEPPDQIIYPELRVTRSDLAQRAGATS